MFEIGDKVVYGQTGVCLITDICEKSFIKNKKCKYYVLKPIGFDNNLVYAPLEGGKIFMRYLITRQEAEALIDSIPRIIEKISCDTEISKEEYNEKINTHSLEDLVALTVIIYSKKLSVTRLKKRLNNVEEKYMKICENLLFGELSEVLGISFNEVKERIEARVGK